MQYTYMLIPDGDASKLFVREHWDHHTCNCVKYIYIFCRYSSLEGSNSVKAGSPAELLDRRLWTIDAENLENAARSTRIGSTRQQQHSIIENRHVEDCKWRRDVNITELSVFPGVVIGPTLKNDVQGAQHLQAGSQRHKRPLTMTAGVNNVDETGLVDFQMATSQVWNKK